MYADTQSLLARAQRHYSRKEFNSARDRCSEILQREPAHRVALYLTALCALSAASYDEAAAALSRLLTHHPDHVNGHVLLSKVCLRLGDHRQSVLHARRVLELNVGDDRVLALAADLLGRSEDHVSARAAYQAALRINPRSSAHLCNYASILRIEGRIGAAKSALEQCIELDPTNCKAHWMLSSLQRQKPGDNHVRRLESVRATAGLSDLGALLIDYALAKEYEDLGRYEESFACLSRANELKRRSIHYDVETDTLPFRQLVEQFDVAYVDRVSGSGFTESGPVFIVGLPRTGSTLIEQILGASPLLFAAGELPIFGNGIGRLFRRADGCGTDFSTLHSRDVDYRELGRTYVEKSIAFIESARHKSPFASTTAFIDKMPQNFAFVGFIALALPNARIIVTQRDAMDTCLSNFQQLYRDPFYAFSYRLDEMGRYFVEYQRLMRHWLKLFGRRIFTLSYEQFVDNPEVVARRVFEYCGVPWRREYLERPRSGLVATASATQVREAIGRESVGRWKRYERQLSRLLEQLRLAGVVS